MKSTIIKSINISINILVLIDIVFSVENELTIIKSEMSETMQEFSIGTALVTLSESSDYNVIADKVVNALNNKYGTQWFSLVGPIGPVSHFNTQPNTLLHFKYGNIQIFLFKPQISQTQTNASKV
jgi:hypothetical protein